MKWSELPDEYRALEETFDKNDPDLNWEETDDISARFLWRKTPQDPFFWLACDIAKYISELPEIPKK